MKKDKIFVIDDELNYLKLMKELLNEVGYENILTETNPKNVIPIIYEEKIDLILCDIRFPEMSGLDLLQKVNQKFPQIPIIMVTGIDDVDTALKAIKLGAYDYITKPPDTDRLFLTIDRALEQKLLREERDSLRKIETRYENKEDKNFVDIITQSSKMYKVFELVEIFAPSNETILIVGETGTGKDLIARKIHQLSPRKDKPFVEVNVASITSSLFESELFGHEKGSFTGATNDKIGYFEAANGGTIFLDEIGELTKSLQGKLLRAIQYNEIYKIGSTKPVKLDLRIIAATNKNLIDAVEKEEFRADLYYRLSRGFIHLPPLKNRDKDVMLLANHFLNLGNKTYNKSIPGFTAEVISTLKNYDFPGNVRELENIIINAVAKTPENKEISSIDLPENYSNLIGKKYSNENNFTTIDEVVNKHIKSVVEQMNGSVQKAAPILGISERTLQRKLKKIRES